MTVMGSKPYRCRHCDFTTNKKNSVFAHCEVRHGFKGSLEDVEIIGKENKFECKVCNMGFVTLPRFGQANGSFLFVKRIIDLPGGQINEPSLGNIFLFCSSQQLPRLRLGLLKSFLS